MKSIEDLLSQMPLKEPSAELDRRIAAILSPGVAHRQWKQVAIWSHLLTAAACLTIGLLLGRSSSQANPDLAVRTTPANDRTIHRILQPIPRPAADGNGPDRTDIDSQTHMVEFRFRDCMACHDYAEQSAAAASTSDFM